MKEKYILKNQITFIVSDKLRENIYGTQKERQMTDRKHYQREIVV